MLFRVWQDDLGVECSAAPGRIQLQLMGLASTLKLVDDEIKILHEFEANTWFEAMTTFHEYMGFKPYQPLRLPNGEIDVTVYEPFE